jgi:FAD/FMN-containing dehydrogenase
VTHNAAARRGRPGNHSIDMTSADIVEQLRHAIGAGSVLSGTQIGAHHHSDFSGEYGCAPRALVRPADTAALAAVLKICSAAGQRVVVQGGLTGLSGGATPQPGEIAISMERISGIEQIDRDSMTATVLAGTPLETVQRAAAEAGFLFPLDLGARGSCTIGGNIATNAGGNQVIRFGMMRNLVLGLEAVLADGTVLSSMNRMLKNNAGYDLKQLFIGTEGTLGIVTRAVLRLWPKLPSRVTALAALSGFDDTVALLKLMQGRLSGSLSAFEVMWDSYFDFVVEHIDSARSPFERRHAIYALIDAEAADDAANRAQLESALEAALEAGLIADAVVAQSEREAQSLWAIRDGIGEVNRYLKPGCSFDVSMPISAMPAFLGRVDREFSARFPSVRNLVFGHVGDNNLHLRVTTGRAEDLAALNDIVFAATGEVGGSVSAEHGIGVLRREYLHYSRSQAEIDLMWRLKAVFDPQGILNAGRVLPPATQGM